MRPTYSPIETVTPQETGFRADKTCFLLRQALPVEECRRLIATVTAAGFRPMGVDYPPGYRNNDRAVLDDAELAAALFDRLRPYLPERVTGPDGATWRLSGLNERFRFCRYADGQSFCIHRDGAWSRRAGERSLLTCMTYLNGAEEFSGGATRYYVDQDPRAGVLGAVSPAAGTMVVFDHDLWHDGEAVIRGVKYVMRTDVMYVREGARELAKSRAGRSTELRGHEGYVWSVLARRDGRLVSASRDRTIRHWRPASGGWREVACWSGHEASVLALAEDNAGRLWSASRDRTVRVWDGCLSEVVGEHDGAGLTLAALPDGCVASGGADGNVQVWSTTRDTSTVLRGHRGWVWALTPLKAHLLASGGDDGQVRLWNPGTGECLAALPLGHGSVRALAALAPDLLVSGHENGTVAIWRVSGTQLAAVQTLRVHSGPVCALIVLAGGALASGGEDGMVHVLEGPQWEPRESLAHGSFVRTLAARPDGRLATGCYDGVVRVWKRGELLNLNRPRNVKRVPKLIRQAEIERDAASDDRRA